MPPRLTFVANASTPAVRAAAFPLDEGLDQRGQQDAEALGKELPRASAVLVSSSRRAKETAAALGLTAEVDEGLRDLDLGRWAGFSINEIGASEPEALEQWLSDPEAAPHGGESVDHLFARISVWLQSISTRDDRVIAVTHPAVIRAAILSAIHAAPTSFWNIDVAPLAIVQLTSNGRRWVLKSIRQ